MSNNDPYIVVEGIGDTVESHYEEKLRALYRSRKVQVVFIYDSTYGKNRPQYRKKMDASSSRLKEWAEVLDISSKSDSGRINNMMPHIVIIATPPHTHCKIAIEWLNRSLEKRYIPQILIEKPLDTDINAAYDLWFRYTRAIKKHPEIREKIYVFDHYRYRWRPDEADEDFWMKKVNASQNGGNKSWLKEFTFYFLEDHSRFDTIYLERGNRVKEEIGPIEVENRVDTLREGLILDLAPHILAFLSNFADLGSVQIIDVIPGRYSWNSDGKNRTSEVVNETFAKIDFKFRDIINQNESRGTAYLGKGISGLDESNKESEVKIAKIKARDGHNMLFLFKLSKKYNNVNHPAWLILKNNNELFRAHFAVAPYDDFLKSLANGELETKNLVSLENSITIMKIIEQMRFPVKKVLQEGQQLPTYLINTKSRQAPSLGVVLKQLDKQNVTT